MAKPRIFVSSTYYDLKHIRSALELFIESLGFEAILSEKGDIPYSSDVALDESCYREAAAADVFVLVIGGRYGSEASGPDKNANKRAMDNYDSITRKEFETAHDADIPVFILIESGVYAEYQTYLRNKDNATIKYAHVDSTNVFRFIEFISTKQRNNPIFSFERSAQIETWLREQWAGLFRELLRTRSQQRQLLALTGQVGELKAVNETLKTYLEVVLSQVTPETSKGVIEGEERRLDEIRKLETLRSNNWYTYVKAFGDISEEIVEDLIRSAKSETDLYDRISNIHAPQMAIQDIIKVTKRVAAAQADYNKARTAFGLSEIKFANKSDHEDNAPPKKAIRVRPVQKSRTPLKIRPKQATD